MRHITHGHFRLYGLVAGLVTVAALVGCSAAGSPDSSASPSTAASSPAGSSAPASGPAQTTTRPPTGGQAPKMVQVVMTKTGGLAGLNQRLLIQPDSTWIFIDGKAGTSQPGRFTDAQSANIAALIADPALKAESKLPTNPVACADAIAYNFQTSEVQFRYDQCTAAASRPATVKLIRAIEDATPL